MRYIVNYNKIKELLEHNDNSFDSYMFNVWTKETRLFKTDHLLQPYGIKVMKNVLIVNFDIIIHSIETTETSIDVILKQDSPIETVKSMITLAERCGWKEENDIINNKLIFRAINE